MRPLPPPDAAEVKGPEAWWLGGASLPEHLVVMGAGIRMIGAGTRVTRLDYHCVYTSVVSGCCWAMAVGDTEQVDRCRAGE